MDLHMQDVHGSNPTRCTQHEQEGDERFPLGNGFYALYRSTAGSVITLHIKHVHVSIPTPCIRDE